MGQHIGALGGGAESVHGHLQPRNFLRPCLLLLLREQAAYGYELREKLAPMSPTQWDMGTVYRALNTMEEEGLVASSWERSDEGPRRRRYDITLAGRAVLDQLAGEMSAMRDLIAELLDRYRGGPVGAVTPWLAAAPVSAYDAPEEAPGQDPELPQPSPSGPPETVSVRLGESPLSAGVSLGGP